MKDNVYTTSKLAHPRSAPKHLRSAPKTNTRKAAPEWKPHPCGLSRSELRRIVDEILG
jgi:hypothetical protein